MDDVELHTFANKFVAFWEVLALHLGLKQYEIDSIKQNQRYNDPVAMAYGMLSLWHGKGDTSTRKSLATALRTIGKGRLADEVESKAPRTEVTVVPATFPPPTNPPVFISYQWGIQETVKKLKAMIEENGYPCWMDIGQMGGGDALNTKIDAGIRSAKVVVFCVTKESCASENCQREASLANNLGKPIIPIKFDNTAWPPPGELSMIFTKLLYIDMKKGDIPPEKFNELLQKIKERLEES